MSNHFAFTKLLVTDLESSAAFYRAVFDLEETYRVQSDIAGRPIEEIMFKATGPGGGTFVLLTFVGSDTPSADELIIGFVTTDLAGVLERAAANGGRVVQPPRRTPQHGVDVAFVADNEGHLIEVVQRIA